MKKSGNDPLKVYRHPSWDSAGYIGGIVTDENGDSYLFPRPFINTLLNDPLKQNTIYKLNGKTGLLTPYFFLGNEYIENASRNAYGIMSISYDCESKSLFVSTVFGSVYDKVNGKIYRVQTGSKPSLADSITGIDAIGVAVARVSGKKYLFFGNARNSELSQIEIDADHKFSGDAKSILSIAMLGISGDDKIRKIIFDSNGEMHLSGMYFNFNLSASTFRQESIYHFIFNLKQKKWILKSISEGNQ